MAWTYSDWITQTTRSARVSRLRLHIQEVQDKIARRMAAGGSEVESRDIVEYRRILGEDLARLEAGTSEIESTDRRRTSAFVRGRPV